MSSIERMTLEAEHVAELFGLSDWALRRERDADRWLADAERFGIGGSRLTPPIIPDPFNWFELLENEDDE